MTTITESPEVRAVEDAAKLCRWCKTVKPLTMFDRHPRAADGHVNKCRPCQRAAEAVTRASCPPWSDADRKRFWSFVSQLGPTPEHRPEIGRCWAWTGSRCTSGYGQIKQGARMWKSGRAAWTIAHGPIPNGLHVLHKCDNRQCVNPAHLFLGTNTDNHADMMAKGRHVVLRGMRQGRAKLTDDNVREIRSLHAEHGVKQSELAARFGVSQPVIAGVIRRTLWRHVS